MRGVIGWRRENMGVFLSLAEFRTMRKARFRQSRGVKEENKPTYDKFVKAVAELPTDQVYQVDFKATSLTLEDWLVKGGFNIEDAEGKITTRTVWISELAKQQYIVKVNPSEPEPEVKPEAVA